MKVAWIILHSFEMFYPEYRNKYKESGALDYEIICKQDHAIHRYCKAAQMEGIESEVYYLSQYEKTVREFTHKYGHKIKRVPINAGGGKYGKEITFTLLKELKKDTFHIIFVVPFYLNRIIDMFDLLALFCRTNKYPFIPIYSGDTFLGLPPLRRLSKRFFLNLSDKIFVQSKAEIKVLEKYAKIRREKIIYFNNPVMLDVFSIIPKEIAAKKLGYDPLKRYILYVGRLSREKGVHHILNILPSLIKIDQNIAALIIGYGPEGKRLRLQVKDKELDNHVSFMGMIPYEDLPLYYNLADIFVLPSYFEGKPSVLQEALACNTPSIGTTVGGVPEVLSNGVGLLVPPGDENRLFDAIKQILKGRFEINRTKRMQLLEEYSMQNVGKRLKEICEEVLNEH